MRFKESLLFLFIISLSMAQSPGNALYFDGTAGKVTIDSTYNLGISTHSVECWVQIPEVDTHNLIPGERVGIVFGNYGESPGVSYEIYDNGQMRILWNDGEVELLGTTDIRDGKWHHLLYVRNYVQNKFKMYLDGVLEAENANAGSNISLAGSHFCIASDHRVSPLYFHGSIDEFRFWSTDHSSSVNTYKFHELSGVESNLEMYHDFNHSFGSVSSNSEFSNGSSYDATITGLSDANWIKSGAFEGTNYCLSFDGTDEYVSFGSSSVLKNTTGLTIEFWLNPDSWTPSTRQQIISNLEDGGYGFSLANDSLRFTLHDGTGFSQVRYPGDSISAGWHHVAGAFKSSEQMLFLDGRLVASRMTSGSTIQYDSDNCTFLGQEVDGDCSVEPGFGYNGKIDELKIWYFGYSEGSIQNEMFKTQRKGTMFLNLYCRFDEGEGSEVIWYGNNTTGDLFNMEDSDWVVSDAFLTWIGTTNTDFSSNYNWTANVPTISSNVSILPGYSTFIPGSTLNVNNLNISSGSTMEINQADCHLSIYGNYFQFGNINFTNGTLSIKNRAFGSSGLRLITTSSADFTSKPLFD